MSKISKNATYSVTDHTDGSIVIEAHGMELYINLNDGTLTTFNAEGEMALRRLSDICAPNDVMEVLEEEMMGDGREVH